MLLGAWCCYAGSAQDYPTCKFHEQAAIDGDAGFFQKQYAPSKTSSLTPYNPQCECRRRTPATSVTGELGGEKLIVYESQGEGWSCVVDNKDTQNYVVRVQTTFNEDNPSKDQSWDFYYFAAAGTK